MRVNVVNCYISISYSFIRLVWCVFFVWFCWLHAIYSIQSESIRFSSSWLLLPFSVSLFLRFSLSLVLSLSHSFFLSPFHPYSLSLLLSLSLFLSFPPFLSLFHNLVNPLHCEGKKMLNSKWICYFRTGKNGKNLRPNQVVHVSLSFMQLELFKNMKSDRKCDFFPGIIS